MNGIVVRVARVVGGDLVDDQDLQVDRLFPERIFFFFSLSHVELVVVRVGRVVEEVQVDA